MSFQEKWNFFAHSFNQYSKEYFEKTQWPKHSTIAHLKKAMEYSLLGEGKRFRPVLAMATAEAQGLSIDKVLPFALAVEMIHTYSLIHDDLPCMDNDDFRRGKPTNHKVYGEDIALLAGDALLTESFRVIAQNYPLQCSVLIQMLSAKAGMDGMISGQVIDLAAQKKIHKIEELMLMHQLKTGALIELSVLGSCVLSEVGKESAMRYQTFAQCLGLAFQIKDDLLDYDPQDLELGSYPGLLGIDKTNSLLKQYSEQALEQLKSMQNNSGFLLQIVEYNLSREK